MRILFLTADLGGNVPPTRAVAHALARRGVVVEVAGVRDPGTGVSSVPFDPALAVRPEGRRGLRELGALRRLMTSPRTSKAARRMISERSADVVVVDCMIPAVLRGALDSGVPVAVLFHTFGSYWIDGFDRGAGPLLGVLGLRPRRLWAEAAERLLLTDSELDPGRADPALADFTWTGTTEVGAERGARSARPRILVALSSSDWPGMLPVYRRIVAALSTLEVDAIVTTAGVDLGGELRGAPNVEIHGWVPHADLLPTVDLVIGHGGHSTTLKVLAHGLPLLVLPINPTADQRMVGELIQRAGLGRWQPKSVNPERLRAEVKQILDDDGIRERAAGTGRRLRAAPAGADVAAERILALSRSSAPGE